MALASAGARSPGFSIGPSAYSPLLGQLRVIDVRVLERRPNRCAIDTAVVTIRHTLNVHDFLVIRAVVVHHRAEECDGGRCPQDARRMHQVAVRLNVHGEAAMRTIGQGGAHGRRQRVADAGAAEIPR